MDSFYKEYRIPVSSLEQYNNLLYMVQNNCDFFKFIENHSENYEGFFIIIITDKYKDEYFSEKYSEYEVKQIYKNDLDNIIKKSVKPYKDKLISLERNEFELLSDKFREYIKSEVGLKIERFFTDGFEIKVLKIIRDYFKNYINYYEFDKKIENLKNQYLSPINLNDKNDLFFRDYFDPKYEMLSNVNEVEIEINKFKNLLVDKILNILNIKQGMREYYESQRKAGKIADLIEGEIWKFFISIENYNKK